MFVDRVTIYVKGGDGGNGALSFRREKYAPKGGPNGGDGGHGGDVVLLADTGNSNLAHLSFQRHWKADRGENGMGADCHGKTAHDMVIKVPVGTIIRDRERGHILKDLKAHGEKVIIARGGKGGFGNAHFKSSTNRAPRQFEKGAVGEDKWIILGSRMQANRRFSHGSHTLTQKSQITHLQQSIPIWARFTPAARMPLWWPIFLD